MRYQLGKCRKITGLLCYWCNTEVLKITTENILSSLFSSHIVSAQNQHIPQAQAQDSQHRNKCHLNLLLLPMKYSDSEVK